ncbi:uncharacterized protein BCR38DRAFT_489351 [Pseudomassariella vexata]|uniref:Uncharacterized protein n=1 Tax=Pseudomassariella vexata TaxID=1141098 RepID=A0A1Y2DHY8_9PEZI|nr:uncharacterized protein BCR38DRAFT_489351 [Pseudomassariella vexata]ORY58425.1 hypothetical protein BCR38DRAFT_489351 [Pseudomassariella vexata]
MATSQMQDNFPGSFYFAADSVFTMKHTLNLEAFVEYWLEVTSTAGNATHSLTVSPQFPGEPITDFNFTSNQHPCQIRSRRLLPKNADTGLTFVKRCSKMFRLSKVPTYFFRVHMAVPRGYQLHNPEPLTLKVWLTPIWEDKCFGIYKGGCSDLPPVYVFSVDTALETTCSGTSSGAVSEHHGSKSTMDMVGELDFMGDAPAIPISFDDAEALDLGGLLNVHFPRRNGSGMGALDTSRTCVVRRRVK